MQDEFIGRSFRQISAEIRWRRDGKRMSSVRPQKPRRDQGGLGSGAAEGFLDLEEPTIITFQAGDTRIDPASLLTCRCIEPYDPPKPKRQHAAAVDNEPEVVEVEVPI